LSATVDSALIAIVTDIGADASGTTRAETKATLSTWIAWNINASCNDKTVQDCSQLREVWSGEDGLHSWNSGSNESDLVDVVS
jgi:hypothetical protein